MTVRSRLRRWIREKVRLRLGRPIVRGPLAEIWWVVAVRALACVLFGAATLVWPRQSAYALVGLFATFAMIDGCMALVAALGARTPVRPWLALTGVSSVAAGVFAFGAPKVAAMVLVGVLGLWLVMRGAAELVVGLSLLSDKPEKLRRLDWEHHGVPLNAAMTMLFGVALIAAPRIGLLSLVWALGCWAILHGLLMMRWALDVRRIDAAA